MCCTQPGLCGHTHCHHDSPATRVSEIVQNHLQIATDAVQLESSASSAYRPSLSESALPEYASTACQTGRWLCSPSLVDSINGQPFQPDQSLSVEGLHAAQSVEEAQRRGAAAGAEAKQHQQTPDHSAQKGRQRPATAPARRSGRPPSKQLDGGRQMAAQAMLPPAWPRVAALQPRWAQEQTCRAAPAAACCGADPHRNLRHYCALLVSAVRLVPADVCRTIVPCCCGSPTASSRLLACFTQWPRHAPDHGRFTI